MPLSQEDVDVAMEPGEELRHCCEGVVCFCWPPQGRRAQSWFTSARAPNVDTTVRLASQPAGDCPEQVAEDRPGPASLAERRACVEAPCLPTHTSHLSPRHHRASTSLDQLQPIEQDEHIEPRRPRLHSFYRHRPFEPKRLTSSYCARPPCKRNTRGCVFETFLGLRSHRSSSRTAAHSDNTDTVPPLSSDGTTNTYVACHSRLP